MRPRFTISTMSSSLRSATGYAELASGVGAEGLDLDATTWVGRLFLQPDRVLRLASCPIATIWVSPGETTALAEGRGLKPRLDSTSLSTSPFGVRLVVRLPDASGANHDQATVINAGRALEACVWLSGVTIAVPALAPEGGRLHLTRMGALRRYVEEWEMDLGLDLTPRSDNRWEAEAAVQIAGTRLGLVRLRESIVSQHTDVHLRTVRACADEGFTGLISLVPLTPFWLRWHQSTVERDLLANRDAVMRLFAESYAPLYHGRRTSLK
jgi:hypothetical protein